MFKKIKILFIGIVIILPLNSQQFVSDKIVNDLIGQEIKTTNEEINWTFKNGDQIKYVVLSQRTTGHKNFKRIDYNVFLMTRHNDIKTAERFRAEGLLKLVYKRSRSRNHNYLSQVVQLGFQVYPINEKENTFLDELDIFWSDFQSSVNMNYKDKVANMFQYPFSTKYFGIYNSSAEMIKKWDNLFTEKLKDAVTYSILTPEKKSKGKEFNIIKDNYIMMCHHEHRIIIDGFYNLFVVKRIDDKFKIVRIINRQANDLYNELEQED